MGQNAVLSLSVAACFVGLTACGSGHYVQRGADLYGEGRFVEADEVFARSEPRVAQAALEQRAAYAAYRGATFVALGDLPHAQHWLTVATEIERARPGTLRSEERAFLDGAWRAYSNRLPAAPPAPAAGSTALASSSQGPPPTVEPAPAANAPVQPRALVPASVPQSLPQ
ncbi:MAG TPA: hypothetical protein VJV79_00925 [Polyangiaceae bacterium]|nr:hypothetical protein [Polyangiaceae bacterium]